MLEKIWNYWLLLKSIVELVVIIKFLGILMLVLGLKIMFVGFIKKRLVLFLFIWMRLLIMDVFFFIIWVRMLWILGLERKLVICFWFSLNCCKLWNKFCLFFDKFFLLMLNWLFWVLIVVLVLFGVGVMFWVRILLEKLDE